MTMKYSIPLEKDLIEKLTQFWMVIFGQRNEELNYILNGDEINDNTDYVYLKKNQFYYCRNYTFNYS